MYLMKFDYIYEDFYVLNICEEALTFPMSLLH